MRCESGQGVLACLERLSLNIRCEKAEMIVKKGVSALLMDVDGTLTDGKIYMSPGGESVKAFHVKDGYGIREILPRHGIIPVIVTGRVSEIVKRRGAELGISHIYQGVEDKGACVRAVSSTLHIPLSDMAFIGDDLNDLPAMRLCGTAGCPADAVDAVREICHFISAVPGGQGAVREFIQWLTVEM